MIVAICPQMLVTRPVVAMVPQSGRWVHLWSSELITKMDQRTLYVS